MGASFDGACSVIFLVSRCFLILRLGQRRPSVVFGCVGVGRFVPFCNGCGRLCGGRRVDDGDYCGGVID